MDYTVGDINNLLSIQKNKLSIYSDELLRFIEYFLGPKKSEPFIFSDGSKILCENIASLLRDEHALQVDKIIQNLQIKIDKTQSHLTERDILEIEAYEEKQMADNLDHELQYYW